MQVMEAARERWVGQTPRVLNMTTTFEPGRRKEARNEMSKESVLCFALLDGSFLGEQLEESPLEGKDRIPSLLSKVLLNSLHLPYLHIPRKLSLLYPTCKTKFTFGLVGDRLLSS